MVSFSSLPNELVIEIWRHVLHPEDIESFALTSKEILALGESFLGEHRTLKEKFSTYYTWRPGGNVSAAGLLKEITIHPRVALYVKKLVVNTWRDTWKPTYRQNNHRNRHLMFSEELNDGLTYFHKRYADTDMQIFEQVVKRNEYAFGQDMFGTLIEAIRDGREDPILALLMLLLTNLEYLVVTKMEYHLNFFKALQNVSNARDAKALRRLSDVELLACPRYADDDDNLVMLKAFATLPSVKRISCRKNRHYHHHRRVKFDLPPRSSNVESLTYDCLEHGLKELGFNTVTLLELIKGFKGLKHFSYRSDTDQRMFAIRNALVANARFSLETLILKPCYCVRLSIGSFRGFKALKKLEIDKMHLADFDPRRLYSVDVLPSSLEELHLHDFHPKGFMCMDPRRIGIKLLEERDRLVPNLKLVTFWNDHPNYPLNIDPDPDLDAIVPGIAELQTMFLAKGLRLELLDGPGRPTEL